MRALKIKAFIILIICSLSSCAPITMSNTDKTNRTSYIASCISPPETTEETRGVWIASVYNIDFPSKPDLPADELKSEIDDIINTSLELGLNTLFFQVHPCSDCLYKSELFPVSVFLSTKHVLYFDPLEYMISSCHDKGISLYAWINPLRVTAYASDNKDDAVSSLNKEKGPGSTPGLLVFHSDGKLYYDPGYPEVADMVSDCIFEIISQYNVDGVVFDDYFYPYPVDGKTIDDSLSYENNSNGESIEDWRRNNINTIIEKSYKTIKDYDPAIKFGVAPFGIWKNGNGGESGSETNGLESFSTLYCDTIKWIEEGYVDFISPQLYWSFDDPLAPYGTLYKWWDNATEGSGVELIPSLGAYNYGNSWKDPEGIMTEQVETARKTAVFRGVIYYGYSQFKENTHNIAAEIKTINMQQIYYCKAAKYPVDIKDDDPITGIIFK